MAQETNPRRRVTIADIAIRAGVSKGAVSYALNGRPGISEATRRRILEISEELGWYPNSAARALSASRAGACGLVLARPARTIAFEPFFMQLLAGIEAELSSRSVGLTIQVVDDVEAEIAVYRRWWAERRVDGVLVVDLRIDDSRVEQIEKLGLPAVIIGGPEGTGDLSAVWSDDAGAVVDVVRYLGRLGHERIARVAGVSEFLHTEIRTQAFFATMAELSLSPQLVTTDYMARVRCPCNSAAPFGPYASYRHRLRQRRARCRRSGGGARDGALGPSRRIDRGMGRFPIHPGGSSSPDRRDEGHRCHGDARGDRTPYSDRGRFDDPIRRGTWPAHPTRHHCSPRKASGRARPLRTL